MAPTKFFQGKRFMTEICGKKSWIYEWTDHCLSGEKWFKFPLNHLCFLICKQQMLLARNQSDWRWIHWWLQNLKEQLTLFNLSILIFMLSVVVHLHLEFLKKYWSSFICFIVFCYLFKIHLALFKCHCSLRWSFVASQFSDFLKHETFWCSFVTS